MEIPRHIRTAEPACSSTPQIHTNLSESACPHIPTRGATRGRTAQREGDRAGLRRVARRGRLRAVHGALEPLGGRRVRGLAGLCARSSPAGRRLRFGRTGSPPALFIRAGPQLPPRARHRGHRGRARGDARRAGRRVRVGLRRGHGVPTALLGRRDRRRSAVDPSSAAELDEGRRLPLCRPAPAEARCGARPRWSRWRSHAAKSRPASPTSPTCGIRSWPGRGPARLRRLARAGRRGAAPECAPGAGAGSPGRLDRAAGTRLGSTGP